MQPVFDHPTQPPRAFPFAGPAVRENGYDPAKNLFLTADAHMGEIRTLASRVAATSASVMILGESGVGKGELARFIHEASPRAAQPFVRVNCSAMPHDLLESEMFGCEAGPRSGAQKKEGKLELADGGTLLLDEIGDMTPALQSKLLHVLDEFTLLRVGGHEPVRVDVRIVSTTNRPLEEAISDGDFRKDLYFRLKVVSFRLPPLRDRRADIAPLCDRFLREHALQNNEPPARLPEPLLRAFLDYAWPGNVRELKHLVQRYLILPDVELVLSELGDLRAAEASVRRAPEPVERRATISSDKVSLKAIAARAAEAAEREVVLQILEETHWNRRRAAARLDICYKTLLNKLHHWNLYDQAPDEALPSGAVAAALTRRAPSGHADGFRVSPRA